MQLRKTILASVLSAALALSAAACGTAEHTQSMSSAAASEHVAETPTPSPEATATASPTAEPTVKSTASPAPESNEVSENAEITAEIEAMAPLLEAHILAQMNGMAFDANDPVYFWQTAAFAVDNCGMTFYSAETTGSALVLSRGVMDIQDCVKSGDVYTVTAALIRDENNAEPQAIFTAELVPNPREDNTVFTYSIRTVKQIS